MDACRHVVRDTGTVVSFAKRSALFALARALGAVWPEDAPTNTLAARAFGAKRMNRVARGCGSKWGGFAGCY